MRNYIIKQISSLIVSFLVYGDVTLIETAIVILVVTLRTVIPETNRFFHIAKSDKNERENQASISYLNAFSLGCASLK